MRGYFGVGSEGISKAMNLGAVHRTAHAFGASFLFTVGARPNLREAALADTSNSDAHVPLYEWSGVSEMKLPAGCQLIGIELDDGAVEMPVFKHPLRAAYLLGPEKGSLSEAAKSRCASLVKIHTRFCINLSLAAALVMYDRVLSLGGYPARALSSANPPPHAEWRRQL